MPPTAVATVAEPTVPVRRRRRRLTGRTVFMVVTIAVLVYLVLGPLLVLVVGSFQDTTIGLIVQPPIPWSAKNYADVLFNSALVDVLWTTFLFTAGSLAFAFVVSFGLSMLIERTDMPWSNLIFILVVAPSGIPTVILAISWSLMVNPTNGVVNVAVRDLFGLTSSTGPFNVYTVPWMILIQGMALAPLTFLLITASLRGMSNTLEDAGRASGAKNSVILRTITIPLLKPAIIGALVYQFVTVVSVLDIPLIIGRPGGVSVLSTKIYDASNPVVGLPNNGVASAYGVLLLVLSLAPLYVYNRIIRQSDAYVTVTGKGRMPTALKLGRWKPVALFLSFGYVAVSFLLPLVVLVWSSLQPYLGAFDVESLSRMTISAYQSVIHDSVFHRGLWNTFVLGVSASLIAMVISTAVSWIIVRTRSRYVTLLDVLAFMPHAFPGVVIGLATLFLYLLLPVPVYGTIWIIVLAMSTQFIGLGTRLTTGGIAQIQVGLEEASRISGGSGWQTTRYVLLPLLRPVIFNGLLVVFLASIQNLTLPLMLGTGDNTVMATLIYGRWFDGDGPGTAALGVVLTVVTLVMTLFLRRSSGARV
ncbi:MAG: ABC transporter permease [Mycobacterium sp.]|uniref:ABC transporter permease n=1 Tax=Mycobacterium sp. TaxID=1785 RepID=UPI00389A33D5